MFSRFVIVLFASFITLLPQPINFYSPYSTSGKIEFVDVNVYYLFGEQITFQAKIQPASSIKEVFLFLQSDGDTTNLFKLPFNARGEVSYQLDLGKRPFRPFARTYYWYRVTLSTGEESISPKYWFEYSDNRFNWQSLDDSTFEAYWYKGDKVFGQVILNVAQSGLQKARDILPASLPKPLRIYVYPSSVDLQNALKIGQLAWVAGHASPDLGVILISVAPGPDQRFELERQIPHEIMHILQYRTTDSGYQHIPIWLAEGMASIAEMYPNPDYQRVVNQSATNGSLLPMNSLCAAFPREPTYAFLAYAQSAYFVRFLHQKYGSSGLQSLLQWYRDGLSCDEGIRKLTGKSLAQIESQWQQETLNIVPSTRLWQYFTPYIIILIIILSPMVIITLLTSQRRQPVSIHAKVTDGRQS